MTPATASIGVDLVSVETVRRSLVSHGDRYLTRIFTRREVADSLAAGSVSAKRLAARFAAKEAAMKALCVPGTEAVPWRSIELVRGEGRSTRLRLTGRAARLAARRGLRELSVSIGHEDGFAVAVVLARP